MFFGKKTPEHSAPYRRETSLQQLNSPIDPELGERKYLFNSALTELCCAVQECCQDSRYGNQDSPSVRPRGQKCAAIHHPPVPPSWFCSCFYSRSCRLMRPVKQEERSRGALRIPDVWQTERAYLLVKWSIRANGQRHPSLSSPARFCFISTAGIFTLTQALLQMLTVGMHRGPCWDHVQQGTKCTWHQESRETIIYWYK